MPPELILRWPDYELAERWTTVLASPTHRRHAEVATILGQFADQLTRRYGGPEQVDQLLRDRIGWTGFFRNNYRQIVRMARQ